jgi:hypothetical protein
MKLHWPFRAEEEGNRVSQRGKPWNLTVLPTQFPALKMEKVIPKPRSADSL